MNINKLIFGENIEECLYYFRYDIAKNFINTDKQIVIINKEDNCDLLLEKFAGKQYVLSSSSDFVINPFDCKYINEKTLKNKKDFILKFILLLYQNFELEDKTIELFKDIINTTFLKYCNPTFDDFYFLVKNNTSAIISNIILEFMNKYPCLCGSTNIDKSSRLVNFNLGKIKEKTEENILSFILLDFIHQHYINNPYPTKIYIDQVNFLFDNEECYVTLKNLYEFANNYCTSFCISTSNEDIFLDENNGIFLLFTYNGIFLTSGEKILKNLGKMFVDTTVLHEPFSKFEMYTVFNNEDYYYPVAHKHIMGLVDTPSKGSWMDYICKTHE